MKYNAKHVFLKFSRIEIDRLVARIRKRLFTSNIGAQKFKYLGLSPCQLPPTRAKSPKLGRRKSCSDTVEKVKENCGRGNRHSTGSYKEETTTAGPMNTKLKCNIPNGNGTSVCTLDDLPQQLGEINMVIPASISGQENVDIAVHS